MEKQVIKLKESQLKQLITETIKKVIKEANRDDIYKSQIEKEFPGALNNYNPRIGYDEYYLQLTNDKKQQDKLKRREDSKLKTAERNAIYKAEYGERDKEIKKQNIITREKEIIDGFVDFLPKNLPSKLDFENKKTNLGYDTIFHMEIGDQLSKFAQFDEDENKAFNSLQKLLNKYEDYFFEKIDEKYGAHVIEW